MLLLKQHIGGTNTHHNNQLIQLNQLNMVLLQRVLGHVNGGVFQGQMPVQEPGHQGYAGAGVSLCVAGHRFECWDGWNRLSCVSSL